MLAPCFVVCFLVSFLAYISNTLSKGEIAGLLLLCCGLLSSVSLPHGAVDFLVIHTCVYKPGITEIPLLKWQLNYS